MICVKCRRRLKDDALSCLCGWSASGDAVKRADCSCVGCSSPALMRVKTETGWANFCVEHYTRYWTRERIAAKPTLRDNRLMAEIRAAYEKSYAKRHGIRRLSSFVREPGQDDEEQRAA